MWKLDLTGVERVLTVTAHPDDVDFGWAGSVAAMTDAGIEVTLLHRHRRRRGRLGDRHPARRRWRALRRDEQRAAAAIVGVHDVHFLGYPDGRLEATLDLRRDISRVIRQVRPEPRDRAVARAHPGPHLREPSRPPRGGRGDDRRGVSRRPQPLGPPRARRRGARAVDGRRGLAGCRRERLRRTTSTSPTRSTARSRRCCRTRASCPTRMPPRRWCGLDRGDREGGRAARGTIRRGGAGREHEMSGASDMTTTAAHPLEMLTRRRDQARGRRCCATSGRVPDGRAVREHRAARAREGRARDVDSRAIRSSAACAR